MDLVRPPFMRHASENSTITVNGDDIKSRVELAPADRHVTFAHGLLSVSSFVPSLTAEEMRNCFYNVSSTVTDVAFSCFSLLFAHSLLSSSPFQDSDREAFEMDRAFVSMSYEIHREHGQQWDENENSIRGLEDYFLPQPKMQTRKEHAHIVLAEQRRQRDTKLMDNERLQDVSSARSRDAVAHAFALGQLDATSAIAVYRDARS